MHAYTASPQKPWILNSGASSHMTGIKQKFVSLNLSSVYLSVKIADGTQSPVLGNGVVQVTPSLTLLMSYMFHDFLLVSCPSVSLLNIVIAK